MAEPLIAQYGPDVPQAIARMVKAVHPRFDADAFLHDALSGYEALALMPRGKHIARALQRHLPSQVSRCTRYFAGVCPAAAWARSGAIARILFVLATHGVCGRIRFGAF